MFNVLFLKEMLSPISNYYKPGVIVEYFSDEIFVNLMNNIPQKDLDIYNNEFEALLDQLKQFLPENIVFKYSKIRDFISQEEAITRLMKDYDKFENEFESLNLDEKQASIAKARRNYIFDSSKSKIEEYEILKKSFLIHELFLKTDWDKGIPWAFDFDMIPIGYRKNNGWGLHLKSAKGSSVQFWVGEGVLVKSKDKIYPTILSAEQLKDYKLVDLIKSNLFKNISTGLEVIKLLEKPTPHKPY